MNRFFPFAIAAGCLLLLPAASHAQTAEKYWVYFVDKGPSIPPSGSLMNSPSLYRTAVDLVKPRSLARRAKVLPAESLVDGGDLPLYQPYLEEVMRRGGVMKNAVKWMNAASFLLPPDLITKITALHFVKEVRPVVIRRVRWNGDSFQEYLTPPRKTASLDYGPSASQVQMINLPSVHDIGITGTGVLIGMLDTGFRWRMHEALRTRHVIAEHDFIFNDDTTANQAADASNQDSHGTLTMSVVGGYMPGKLIGAAFNADFILGKTEFVPTETQIEEDNWAAAIEWMEGFGVDVVSSSLGYNDFDPQGPSPGDYTWANGDFNGRTSVTAMAAVRAARLGVVVCDAMGNELNGDGTVGTMLTPADADSIISVGAVNFARHLAPFSSTGPTNDGRFKPDVVTPGVTIYCASTSGPSSYFFQQGTSLSTPLAAGAAALLLSARPELTPIEVRDALRNTADTIDVGSYPVRPNNFTGWGLVNVFNAATSFGPIFSNKPAVTVWMDSGSRVSITAVSMFGLQQQNVLLHYAADPETTYNSLPMTLDSSMYFPTSGRYSAILPLQTQGTLVNFYIEAADSASNVYRSPALSTGKVWQLNYGVTGVQQTLELPRTFVLSQNFPNPFNPTTVITYAIPTAQWVTLKVFNVLGKEVAVLIDGHQEAGHKSVEFNGADLSSGVYFYRLTTSSVAVTKKMILLR